MKDNHLKAGIIIEILVILMYAGILYYLWKVGLTLKELLF